jgi:hypothetical protein
VIISDDAIALGQPVAERAVTERILDHLRRTRESARGPPSVQRRVRVGGARQTRGAVTRPSCSPLTLRGYPAGTRGLRGHGNDTSTTRSQAPRHTPSGRVAQAVCVDGMTHPGSSPRVANAACAIAARDGSAVLIDAVPAAGTRDRTGCSTSHAVIDVSSNSIDRAFAVPLRVT